MTTTVKVLPNFHIYNNEDGVVYHAGETTEVHDDAAKGWEAWGSVEIVRKSRKKDDTTKD